MTKKEFGNLGEEIAWQAYQQAWWHLQDRHFATRSWEIDLVVEKAGYLAFVEVKIIDSRDDLHDYITPRKLERIRRTMHAYLHRYPSCCTPQIDVVFVKEGRMAHWFQNITLY